MGTCEFKNCSHCNFRGIAYFYDFFDVFLAYIIMYFENQASRHSPPPIPHSPLRLRHRTAWSCDHSHAERGWGNPPGHRSCDTRQISGEMRTLGLVGPLPRLDSKYTWIMHLFSVHARQAHIRPRRLFFAYSALNINFKGVLMKLRIVALAISVDSLFLRIFLTFF